MTATPVVLVESGGTPVTIATNGFGMPVTVSDGASPAGMPVTVVEKFGTPVVLVPRNKAAASLGSEPKGFALDATDMSAVVRGGSTNFEGDPNSLLTYSDPSPKYIWQNGLLVPGTTLRCDHDPATGEALGVLVEGQAGNLATYSDDFTNAAWAIPGATITGGKTAPDGSANAVEFKGQSSGQLLRGFGAVGVSGGMALAVFAKSADNVTWVFNLRNATTGTNLKISNINLVAGTSSDPSAWQIEPCPNGWYRASCVATTGISDGDSIVGYFGGSTLSSTTSAIQLWGADLFNTPKVSSHISTTDSAVTRAADDITLPLTDFPWNSGSGTLTLNGSTVDPILNASEDALDIAAIVMAADATHLKTLKWVPS